MQPRVHVHVLISLHDNMPYERALVEKMHYEKFYLQIVVTDSSV